SGECENHGTDDCRSIAGRGPAGRRPGGAVDYLPGKSPGTVGGEIRSTPRRVGRTDCRHDRPGAVEGMSAPGRADQHVRRGATVRTLYPCRTISSFALSTRNARSPADGKRTFTVRNAP